MKIELIKRAQGEEPSVRIDLDDDYHIDVKLSRPFGPRELAWAMHEAATMITNRDRGTGRTTRQIIAAPKDAIFVCKSHQYQHARRLANHLGRHDLKIVPVGSISMESFIETRREFVVDHAAQEDLTPRIVDGMRLSGPVHFYSPENGH